MSYLLSEFELYSWKKNLRPHGSDLMIASYQFKYWVFGVPGQQMGRELRASPVVFLKRLMGLFYLA